MNSTIQIGRVSSFKVKTLSNVLTRKKKKQMRSYTLNIFHLKIFNRVRHVTYQLKL